MRVLILDSSPIFRMGLKQIMTQIGKNNGDLVEVYEGDNISDGVNIAKCYNLDIILLDENIGISDIDSSIMTNMEGIITLFNKEKIICKSTEQEMKSGKTKSTEVIFLCDKMQCGGFEDIKIPEISGLIMKNANEEDVIYALNVIMRGGRYYSPECIKMKPSVSVQDNLTKRESEVLDLLKEGKTNYEIGRELYISEATAKKHVSNILGKLGLKNRVEAVIAVNNSMNYRNFGGK